MRTRRRGHASAAASLACLVCSGIGTNPVIELYMYTVHAPEADAARGLVNRNLEDLQGAVEHLHREVVTDSHAPDAATSDATARHVADPRARSKRNWDIMGIAHYRFLVRNPNSVRDLGDFVAFTDGQVTERAQWPELQSLGDFVGVQEHNSHFARFANPHYWFSLPGFCPDLPNSADAVTLLCPRDDPCPGKDTASSLCQASSNRGRPDACLCYADTQDQMIGGLCSTPYGQVPDHIEVPTGDRGCVYSYDPEPLVVSLDEVTGISTLTCSGGMLCKDWEDFRYNCSDASLRRSFLQNGTLVEVGYCVEYDMHPDCAAAPLGCDNPRCLALLPEEREVGLPFWLGRCDAQSGRWRVEMVAAAFGMPGALRSHVVAPAPSTGYEQVSCSRLSHCRGRPLNGEGFCTRTWSGVCSACRIPGTARLSSNMSQPLCPWDLATLPDYRSHLERAANNGQLCRSSSPDNACCLYTHSCDFGSNVADTVNHLSAVPVDALRGPGGLGLVLAAQALNPETDLMERYVLRLARERLGTEEWVLERQAEDLRLFAYWAWEKSPPRRWFREESGIRSNWATFDLDAFLDALRPYLVEFVTTTREPPRNVIVKGEMQVLVGAWLEVLSEEHVNATLQAAMVSVVSHALDVPKDTVNASCLDIVSPEVPGDASSNESNTANNSNESSEFIDDFNVSSESSAFSESSASSKSSEANESMAVAMFRRRDRRLGEVKGGGRSCSGTLQGEACALPFTYKGKIYFECTRADSNDLWCYTAAPGGHAWGICDCSKATVRALQDSADRRQCQQHERCARVFHDPEQNCCPSDRGIRFDCCDPPDEPVPTIAPAPAVPSTETPVDTRQCGFHAQCAAVFQNDAQSCCPNDFGVQMACCDPTTQLTEEPPEEPTPTTTLSPAQPIPDDPHMCRHHARCAAVFNNDDQHCCPTDNGVLMSCCDALEDPEEPGPVATGTPPADNDGLIGPHSLVVFQYTTMAIVGGDEALDVLRDVVELEASLAWALAMRGLMYTVRIVGAEAGIVHMHKTTTSGPSGQLPQPLPSPAPAAGPTGPKPPPLRPRLPSPVAPSRPRRPEVPADPLSPYSPVPLAPSGPPPEADARRWGGVECKHALITSFIITVMALIVMSVTACGFHQNWGGSTDSLMRYLEDSPEWTERAEFLREYIGAVGPRDETIYLPAHARPSVHRGLFQDPADLADHNETTLIDFLGLGGDDADGNDLEKSAGAGGAIVNLISQFTRRASVMNRSATSDNDSAVEMIPRTSGPALLSDADTESGAPSAGAESHGGAPPAEAEAAAPAAGLTSSAILAKAPDCAVQ